MLRVIAVVRLESGLMIPWREIWIPVLSVFVFVPFVVLILSHLGGCGDLPLVQLVSIDTIAHDINVGVRPPLAWWP